MIKDRPSKTALRVARRRAAHQLLDQPVVFDDPLALRMAGIAEVDALRNDPREGHPVARTLRAFLAARSRFAEEYLGRAVQRGTCLLYTSPSPRDGLLSRMPSSA